MIEKIEAIPKIPDALRLAALQRKIIPFVGAGVSQLGGCPGWDQFANAALQFFLGKGKLTHAQGMKKGPGYLTGRLCSPPVIS